MSKTASQTDRAYFARIAQANLRLEDEPVPRSLDEMFDRLDRIRQSLGAWALPGILSRNIPPLDNRPRNNSDAADDQDVGDQDDCLQDDSHLRFLAHVREVLKRGTQRP